jgi:hypothetical protein
MRTVVNIMLEFRFDSALDYYKPPNVEIGWFWQKSMPYPAAT